MKIHGELPPDYDERVVSLEMELPEIDKGDDYTTFSHLCPEVPLFHRNHTPAYVPAEAVTTMDWTIQNGICLKEHKHFTECMEFIKTQGKSDVMPKTQVGYIYIINLCGSSMYKIGWTANGDIEKRRSTLQTGSPKELRTIGSFAAESRLTEKTVQTLFAANRCSGEWFKLERQDVTNLLNSE